MTVEKHGYNAVQVGYQVVPERKITKPELNHLKKSGCPPMRKLKEYKVRPGLLQCFFAGLVLCPSWAVSSVWLADCMVCLELTNEAVGFCS